MSYHCLSHSTTGSRRPVLAGCLLCRERESKRSAGPAFPALLSDRRKLQR